MVNEHFEKVDTWIMAGLHDFSHDSAKPFEPGQQLKTENKTFIDIALHKLV